MRILDIGAGKGTKTAVLQGLAVSGGAAADVTAVDVHAHKLEALRGALRALDVPVPALATVDATDPAALSTVGTGFDAVLVDAPCSGLGTLRRHPEKRWRLSAQDIERLARLQSELLDAAATVVRLGGVVVYSTCTITHAENQGVVSSFLTGERGRAFKTKPLTDVIDLDWQKYLTPEGWFRSWPEPGCADGHFVAALQRTGV